MVTLVGIPLLLKTRKMTRIAVPMRMLNTSKGTARRKPKSFLLHSNSAVRIMAVR
jgi:hypothetical protein